MSDRVHKHVLCFLVILAGMAAYSFLGPVAHFRWEIVQIPFEITTGYYDLLMALARLLSFSTILFARRI